MLKIYSQKDLGIDLIRKIISDKDRWSFPLEELDYLIKEHDNESFVYVEVNLQPRLYEYEEGE